MTNNSGHGTDVVAVRDGPPPEVRVIEVKANTSQLHGRQRDGGYDHTVGVIDRLRNSGRTDWTDNGLSDRLNDLGLDGNGDWTRDPAVRYEIWNYRNIDPEAQTVGQPIGARWSPGTLNRTSDGRARLWFEIDAETGQLLRDRPIIRTGR